EACADSWDGGTRWIAVDHDGEGVGKFNRASIRWPGDREKDGALAVRWNDTRRIAHGLGIDAVSCAQPEAGGLVADRLKRFVFQPRAEDKRVIVIEAVGLLQTNFVVVKLRHGRMLGASD